MKPREILVFSMSGARLPIKRGEDADCSPADFQLKIALFMLPSAALTDPGLKRKINEDCYLINRPYDLYVLADGMGGHAAGEIASHLVASTIEQFMLRVSESPDITWPLGYNQQTPFEHNVLETALQLANSRVNQSAQQAQQFLGMGATVVVAWIRKNKAFYCHIGDSRLYLLRDGRLSQLTQDHSLVQEQVSRGLITPAQAKTHRLRHVVTQAVGGRDPLEVSIKEQELEPGDHLLLCSDGLTDCLTDPEICRILSSADALDARCQELVESANRAGGDDNITVVLLEYQPAAR